MENRKSRFAFCLQTTAQKDFRSFIRAKTRLFPFPSPDFGFGRFRCWRPRAEPASSDQLRESILFKWKLRVISNPGLLIFAKAKQLRFGLWSPSVCLFGALQFSLPLIRFCRHSFLMKTFCRNRFRFYRRLVESRFIIIMTFLSFWSFAITSLLLTGFLQTEICSWYVFFSLVVGIFTPDHKYTPDQKSFW